jgi:hypothetical protein
MRFSNRWIVLICLLVTVGCREDEAPSEEVGSAQGVAPVELQGEGEEGNETVSATQRAINPADKKERNTGTRTAVTTSRVLTPLNRPVVDPLKVSKLADRAAPARRTPPPKGVDAYADFKGTRIAFVHTGNLIGEIDPCG